MKIKSITSLKDKIPTYDFEAKNNHHYLLDNWCVSHNTSLVVWTTAWLLPVYKKYFVENNWIMSTVNTAPNIKKFMWFYKEYVNMEMTEVIDMIAVIQKWIDQSISFEWMIDPSRTQPKDLYNYYIKAWESWIKTVYYVRSMSLDVKECVSCSW